MKLRYVVSLLASTAFVPAMAHAQAVSDDACAQLLQSLPQDSTVTTAQVEEYQATNNTAACQAVLSEIELTQDAAGTAQAANPTEGAGSGAEITVEGGAPNIDVQQAAPRITIEQPQSQVSVQQGQPEVIIHQPAPRISIDIPPPQITFRMPAPEVNVVTPEPQVSVNQAEPEVAIVRAPDDGTSNVAATASAPEPIVRYETEEALVEVTQADQPDVRFEDAVDQEQVAAGQAGPQVDPGAGTPAAQDQAASEPTAVDEQQAMTGAVQVQTLQGMPLVGGDEMGSLGTVSAVIMDTQDRPFVIVDRGDHEVAVMVEYVRLESDRLVLEEFADTSQFPPWDRNGEAAQEVRELSADQTIELRQAS